jgi:hypothetical protein
MNWIIVLPILILWNLGLTYFVWTTVKKFKNLTNRVEGGNLEEVLKEILKKEKLTEKEIDKIKQRIDEVSKQEKFALQKMSLVKFNPFSDLGGDQSFSLALLDGHDRGLVITGLHGRKTTRVYTKIINGEDVKLSEEEKKAIKQAKKKK